FARLEGVSEAKEVADRYIGLLGLPDDGRLTAELSAGNQQRLHVPRAPPPRRAARVARPAPATPSVGGGCPGPRAPGRRRLRNTEPRGARALRHPGRRPRRRRVGLRRQPRAVQGFPRSGCVRMKKVSLLLKKDLRILGRSPVLVAALIVYPLVFAALVGSVVRYAGDRPTIAFVDLDHLPEQLTVGGQTFNVP